MPSLPEQLPGRVAPTSPVERELGRAAAGLLLGRELRGWREARGLTLRDVAPVIRGSVSKISRLERGESPPKERDVMDLARHYGVDTQELRMLGRLLEYAQDCEWYEAFSDVTPGFLRRLIQLEGDAKRITIYENLVVPGLLQTKRYARHMVRAVMPGASPVEIDRVAELRIQRQRVLSRPGARVTALLDEGVLRRRVGDAEVMREQLSHLLEAWRTAKVNIRVIEMDQGYGVAPVYPITHLEFQDAGTPELVYVEHINGANYVTRRGAIDDYRHSLTTIRTAASSLERTRQLLEEARAKFS
ncbi:helix-turn-helix domain-containing protein [Streptomyces sp. NPDC059443]|uniref:helix-turn-helix domain-containing protein n=1 Tax=unclassified Streptomyces TaxID=2593676 RepID=UPI0036771DFD